jgi:predicted TIM-barrel fold metal-dependent hydrolase
MIDGMFVFDAHSHIYPPRQTVWGWLGQTYEDWLKRMQRNGIDMAQVMALYELTPEAQRVTDDQTWEAIKRYPDRFIGFMWNTPLWGARALEEMRYRADCGFRGMKLYSPGQGNYPVDSPLVDPLIDLAEKLNWVVMIHTDIDSKVCNPHLAVRLAKRHPNVAFILAHMGMNSDVTYFIPDYVKDVSNVYLDTSDTPGLAQAVYKAPMEAIPDRLLFGSDAPTLSPEVEIRKLEVAEELYGLTKGEKRKILGENAARLFKIDTSKYHARKVGVDKPADHRS